MARSSLVRHTCGARQFKTNKENTIPMVKVEPGLSFQEDRTRFKVLRKVPRTKNMWFVFVHTSVDCLKKFRYPLQMTEEQIITKYYAHEAEVTRISMCRKIVVEPRPTSTKNSIARLRQLQLIIELDRALRAKQQQHMCA